MVPIMGTQFETNLIAIMCDRLHQSVMAHNLWLISVDLCLECLETTEGLLCGDNLKFIFKIVKNYFLGSTVNKGY